MAKLKAAARNKLPDSVFGMPASRKYPMDTEARAANAKARATQQWVNGKMSTATHSKIIAKANRKLGK